MKDGQKVILVDTRETGDWCLDLFYSGLVRNLGPPRAIDFPARGKHRMGLPVLQGLDPEKDWGQERASMAYVPNYRETPQLDLNQVNRELRQGNVGCIFVDERQESFELYCQLRANIFDVPVIVLSGHDRFWNISPEFVRQNYYPRVMKAMYLDNWVEEYSQLPYARIYNWGTNFDHFWDPTKRADLLADKKYDISFMGYASHPSRKVVIDHVRANWSHLNNSLMLEERPNTFSGFVPKREYFTTIAQSKICLNMRGAASNGKALRFLEIPYVGSFMLSETWPGSQYQLDPIPCRYFSTLDELDQQIDWALSHPVEREVIAAMGYASAVHENSIKRRVAQVLKEV